MAGCDEVRTTVALSAYDLSGFAVSEALVERGIVVEKAGVNTITLITTFQLEEAAVGATVRALQEILIGRELPDGDGKRMPANPFRAIDDRPVMQPVPRAPLRQGDRPRGAARPGGRPGRRRGGRGLPARHPVILEGFRVSEDAVRYLREAHDLGGAIVARDTSLATLRVL